MHVVIGFFLTLCIIGVSVPQITAITPALILTPLINQNRTSEARNLSTVDPRLFLDVKSHSGYFTVDEKYDSNMFFWYFPVADESGGEKPWILWLQGGPGASSLAGIFDEIGPFVYSQTTTSIKLREYSWTKKYSVLFIDNPVGAGFSFTNSVNGFVKDMNVCGDYLYSVLQQFLTVFPELRKAPLYIAGESYAGRYIPVLAKKIMDVQSDGNSAINLQGLILGSPVLNRENIINYTSSFYQWGLIDSQGVLAVKKLQDEYSRAVESGDSEEAYVKRDLLLSKLEDIALQTNMYNLLKDATDYSGFSKYINRMDVTEALHTGNIKFTFSNHSVSSSLMQDTLSKVRPKIESLLEHYRLLIFCGQLDLMIPCVPNMEARRKYWQWSGRDAFLRAPRTPWWFNETVAGYVKSGGRFTEVLVRDAGHLTPMDKPAQIQQLVSYFIRGLDMPLPPNYQVDPQDTPEYIYREDVPYKYNSNAGLIGSVVINVILVAGIVVAAVYFLRWRRRNEPYFYSNTNDVLSDGVLSLA